MTCRGLNEGVGSHPQRPEGPRWRQAALLYPLVAGIAADMNY